MQLPGQQACAAAQGVVQRDRQSAVGRYKIQRTLRNFCAEHFLQAQRLRAKLNFIFLLVAQGAVLVFNGVKLYGEIRRREKVIFTPELRAQVKTLLSEMHALYRRGYTPKVKPTKSCNACSLKELCLPRLMKAKPVSAYLKAALEETP